MSSQANLSNDAVDFNVRVQSGAFSALADKVIVECDPGLFEAGCLADLASEECDVLDRVGDAGLEKLEELVVPLG
eukprot:1379409-Rhodomonas_salina.1